MTDLGELGGSLGSDPYNSTYLPSSPPPSVGPYGVVTYYNNNNNNAVITPPSSLPPPPTYSSNPSSSSSNLEEGTSAPIYQYEHYSPQITSPTITATTINHAAPIPIADVPLQTYAPGHGFVSHDEEHFCEDDNFPPHMTSQPDIMGWIRDGWHLYRRHWLTYSLFQVLPFVLLLTVYIVANVTHSAFYEALYSFLHVAMFPLIYGYFIAGSSVQKQINRNVHTSSGEEPKLEATDLLRGYLLVVPLFAIFLLYLLAVSVGLILLIVPGIYLAVTLSFTACIYIEYHVQTHVDEENNLGPVKVYNFLECFKVSRRIIHAHFWRVLVFLVLLALIQMVGMITMVGILITTPIVSLSLVPAFHDLFGLQQNRNVVTRFVVC